MGDKIKIVIALLFFVIAVILPLGAIATVAASFFGWVDTEIWVGALWALGLFIAPFVIGVLFIASVKDPGWVTTFLPYLFSVAYTFIPDFIPFSIDDAAAMAAGAIFSAFLAIRKNPATPRWIFIPLIGAAIYTFFGGALPGPIDEALVDILALMVAGFGIQGSSNTGSNSGT